MTYDVICINLKTIINYTVSKADAASCFSYFLLYYGPRPPVHLLMMTLASVETYVLSPEMPLFKSYTLFIIVLRFMPKSYN